MSTDTFAGSGALTAPWVNVAGAFNQSGGLGYANSAGASSFAVYDESLGLDHECSVIINPSGGGQFIGPAVRCSKVAHTGATVDAGSDGIYISTWVAGTDTPIAGPLTAPSAPYTVTLRASGDDLLYYLDGVLTATYTGALAGFTDVNAGMSGYANGTGTGATDWTSSSLGGGTVSITSVSAVRNNEQTIVVGTGFSSSGNSVDIDGVAQTIISESITTIVFQVVRATMPYGAGKTITVENSGAASSDTDSVTLLPQSGWDYVVLVAPLADSADRITAVDDLAADDQLAWDTHGVGGVVINDDASFSVATSVSQFDVECWSDADVVWGTTGIQRFPGPPGTLGMFHTLLRALAWF